MGHEGLDRREFLRRAGLAGSAVLAPGLLAACGSQDATTTAAGAGDGLKIGYVTPRTGPLAPFGEADDFVLRGVRESFRGGLRTRTGVRPVEIVVKDSQSSPDRAGAVAGDLILRDRVDLVLVSSTPETTNPVSDQCELNGVPCISTVAPWQSWFLGRGGDLERGFRSTYHFFWGLEDLIAVYTDMWGQIRTNRSVGALWPNDSDGAAFAAAETGFPSALRSGGYDLVDPGRYENATNDFSAQISRYRSGDAEILTGVPIPPDFTNFYKQAAQQGYRPRAVTIAKAILFPSAVEALGEIGDGVSTEVWWSPEHPFRSSITGDDARTVAAAYTTATRRQWTQPIGFAHALFEVARDVLGRAANPKDRQAVARAIGETDLETIVGRVAFRGGPAPNVAKTPLTGGQWRRRGDGFDLVIVSNREARAIPRADRLQAIT